MHDQPIDADAQSGQYDTLDEVPWNTVKEVAGPDGNTVRIDARGFAVVVSGNLAGVRIPLDAHGPWRTLDSPRSGDEPTYPDPVDAHRALQKAARELAHYADHGNAREYLESIDRLADKLQAVRALADGLTFVVAQRDGRNETRVGKVKTHDEQLQDLRDALLAMAVALGAALPMTTDVSRTLGELAGTWDARSSQ